MSSSTSGSDPSLACPLCGTVDQGPFTPILIPRDDNWPWRLHDRSSVVAYVASLSDEVDEWLLAMFVDPHLALLSVETIARGDARSVTINFRHLIGRGLQIGAAGFLLVHNHPSGDPRASAADVAVTSRLRRVSADLDMPLLDHLIIAGGQVRAVGWGAGAPPVI